MSMIISGSSPFVPTFLPPPPPHQSKSSMPIFYYGLVVVGAASIILAIYNFMILRWCTNQRRHMSPQQTPEIPLSTNRTFQNHNTQFVASSFKYKKEQKAAQDQGEYECPVCISVFEEGEEVRQLPRCKHSFHAPCIDMWLQSHFDCPVCRAPVRVPTFRAHEVADQSENSREVLLVGNSSV